VEAASVTFEDLPAVLQVGNEMPLTVRVLGPNGEPVAGIQVSFRAESGGGQITLPMIPEVDTGSSGRARITIKATQVGQVSVIARTLQKEARVSIQVVPPPTVTPTEAPAEAPIVVSPTAVPATNPAPATVTPTAQIRLVIEPADFDLGIGETADLLVQASQADGGAPVANTQITLSVAPPELAQIQMAGTGAITPMTVITATTDDYGEVKGWQLTGGQVGQGRVSAQLETGEEVTATLTVRPVVVAPSANINLRSVATSPPPTVDPEFETVD